MASSFAGIPMEGSGARPLEADLYGPEQQGAEQENIAATGNLNVSNVMDYDAATQREMMGVMQDEPEQSPWISQSPHMVQPDFGDSTSNYSGGDTTFVQSTAYGSPFLNGGTEFSDSAASLPQDAPLGPIAAPTFVQAPAFSQSNSDSSSSTSLSRQSDGSVSITTINNSFVQNNNFTQVIDDSDNRSVADNSVRVFAPTYRDSHDFGSNHSDSHNSDSHNSSSHDWQHGNGHGESHGGDITIINSPVINNQLISIINQHPSSGEHGGHSGHGGSDTIINVLQPVTQSVGNSLTNITDIVVNNFDHDGGHNGGLLQPVLNVVQSVTNNVNAGGLLEHVVNVVHDQASTIVNTVDHTVTTVVGQVGDTISETVTHVGDITGAVIPPVIDIVHDTVNVIVGAPGGLLPPVVEAVTDIISGLPGVPTGDLGDLPVVGDLLGGNLLDVNLSAVVPGGALPPADDHALINADLALLAPTDIPHAAGTSLLDVDAAILSAPQDGVSATLNIGELSDHVLPGLDVPVVELNLPLPTGGADAGHGLSGLEQLGQAGAELGQDLTDHAVQLTALGADIGHALAVDAGVLFSQPGAGEAGAEGHASIPTLDLDVGNLLHHGFIGHA